MNAAITRTAIEAATKELGVRAEPTVVYVADTLAHGKQEIPYPIIAGLNANSGQYYRYPLIYRVIK